jgi:hypothetical protein
MDLATKPHPISISMQPNVDIYFNAFPYAIPAVREMNILEFHPDVTFFVGENGSGKSTILEATRPESSPLSWNSLTITIPVNQHCLFDTFDLARNAVEQRLTAKFGLLSMITGALAVLTAGCSPLAPYSQTVVGSLLQSGAPLANVAVRLVVSTPGQSQPCSPAVAEAVTNQEGKFSLSAQYSPRWSENFVVLIQHHVVCVQLGSSWSPAWELNTGPAIHNASLRCVLSQDQKMVCES